MDPGTHFSGLQEELIVFGSCKELYHLGLWPFLEWGLSGRGGIITDGGGVAVGKEKLRLLPSRQAHKDTLVSLELAKASVTAASQPSSPIVPLWLPVPSRGPTKEAPLTTGVLEAPGCPQVPQALKALKVAGFLLSVFYYIS